MHSKDHVECGAPHKARRRGLDGVLAHASSCGIGWAVGRGVALDGPSAIGERGSDLSAMRPRDDVATGSEGAGRFLRGTITERFLPRWRDGDIPGAGIALSGVPVTVIGLTDTIREITYTVPGT